jgi:heterodisulfide reductase subunit A
MGCGTCVAACPLGAIARPGVANEDVREQMARAERVGGAPRLVAFVCDWCLRADADVELLEGYSKGAGRGASVHVVHIPCSGRIDPEMALSALRSGIDGVLVCGCRPGECHYRRGTLVGACKIGLLNRMMDRMQVGGGRVRFVQIGTQDRGRIRDEIDAMLEGLLARKETDR